MASSATRRAVPRPYCLFCYAPLPRYEGSRALCPRCGAVNVKQDQRVYWTREPRLRHLEAVAKVAIVVLLVGLVLGASWFGPQRTLSIGLGQGWAVGFPILAGYVLWETASKLTREGPYFRGSIVWTVIPLVAGLPALLAGTSYALLSTRVLPAGRILLLSGLLLTAIGLCARPLGRRFEVWRTERILARGRTASLLRDERP